MVFKIHRFEVEHCAVEFCTYPTKYVGVSGAVSSVYLLRQFGCYMDCENIIAVC